MEPHEEIGPSERALTPPSAASVRPPRSRRWARVGLGTGVILAAAAGAFTACSKDDGDGGATGAWAHEDLFARMEFERGESEQVAQRFVVSRGSWKPESYVSLSEGTVIDDGVARLATFVNGLLARRFSIPVPPDFDAERVELRMVAPGTEGFAVDATWVGLQTKVLPRIELPALPEPRTVEIDLPAVPEPELLILDISGSAPSVGLVRATFTRRTPQGQQLTAIVQGPTGDRRRSVALRAGARVVSLDAFDGVTKRPKVGSVGRIAVASALPMDPSATAKVTASIEAGGKSVAKESIEVTGKAWKQLAVQLPRTGGPFRVAFEVADDSAPCFLAEGRLVGVSPEAPTVLLITSDTHRGDHLGRFGAGDLVMTPVLDALADRGVFFSNCFASTNTTNPSHIALMTGVHPRDTRILDNVTALVQSANTLADAYRAAGYRTFGATSVMHLTREQSGLGQGFDRYDAPAFGKRDGRVAIGKLFEWIKEAGDQPVFAWLHVYDAHAPYDPPQDLIGTHYPSDRDPKDPARSLDLPAEIVGPWIKERGYTDREYIGARYRAAVDYVDVSLADLLGLDRMKRAIIAFTADHGESLGADGIWWEHTRLNIATLHVPMILAWPGCTAQQVAVPVEQIQTASTLAELSQLGVTFPTRSMLGALEPNPTVDPRFGLSGHGWSAVMESGGWLLTLQIKKYPRPMGTRQWEAGEVELFDLRKDPEGTQNLVEEEFARAKKMRAALIQWLEQAEVEGLGRTAELSKEAQASLSELGYGGVSGPRTSGSWWKTDRSAPWVQRFEGSN